MSEEKLPAVAQKTEIMKQDAGIALPPEFMGFTKEDVSSEMLPVYQSYAKQYKYFMRSNNAGQFEMTDNTMDKSEKPIYVSQLGEKIRVILVYGHHTKVLLRGYKEGRTDDIDTWPEFDKEVLAMSYCESSNGNFVNNKLAGYLKAPLRDAVKTKLNIIGVCPDLPSKWEPIFMSYGITSDDAKRSNTFATLRLDLDKFNRENGLFLPIGGLVSEMFFVSDENKAGTKKYQRPGFSFVQTGGKPVLSFATPEIYRSHVAGLKLLKEVEARHKTAILSKENDFTGVSVGGENQAVSPQYSNEFEDDIPM